MIVGIFFLFSGQCRAQDNASRPAVTIINPIRGNGLGHESDDLVASLKAQWQITKDQGITATWLFQYGALENAQMTEFAKEEMKGQEFGLLFEIDRNQAEKSAVQFRGQVAWYSSDGLLLSSYDGIERRKLIDTAFSAFRKTFGYYPKTVGAWWIGGDSLVYMQRKYGITAALRAADQFSLDFYSIWGTPWNIPYLSSKENEGMPAASFAESAKVVLLQWAIRDPLEGYADPTFSLQDYGIKGYTSEYVDYLASIFLQKPFGNMVMGLENVGTPELYQQSYKTMLIKAIELHRSKNVAILPAYEYAEQYLAQKKVFASQTHFLSTDYDSGDQSFWYMSENYRLLIQKRKDDVSVVDLRNYSEKLREDFDTLPNSQSHLRIDEPSIVDSMRFPNQQIKIGISPEPLTAIEANSESLVLYAGSKKIAYVTPTACTLYLENNTTKTFSFTTENGKRYPVPTILAVLYGFYLLIIVLYRRTIKSIVQEYLPLLIPLVFACTLFPQSSTFLFDKKELLLFPLFFLLPHVSIPVALIVGKILPFFLLILLHYLLVIRFPGKPYKRWYMASLIGISFLYFHVPYIPLDRTTYVAVGLLVAGVVAVPIIAALHLSLKKKPGNLLILYLLASFLLLVALVTGVVFSRSRLVLTPYEISALEVIKQQKKNVILVEEVDYSIFPIYKAFKPLIYKNYWITQLITGKTWEVVARPENNILNLTNYDKKLIVIPRYLGTDISDYEITELKLKKIFDNAQIAIFEKN